MIVTILMILICVIIFIMINFVDKSDSKDVLAIKYGAFYPLRVEYKKEYWRFLTANFVHVDIAHLFMNCYALYCLGGTFFEPYLGTFAYIYLILISGICSSAVTYIYAYYYENAKNIITLGASGIFYGFLGAIVTLGLVFKGPFLWLMKQFMPVIVINVAFTLLSRHISKTGHLGGFLGGVIAMAVLIFSGICVY